MKSWPITSLAKSLRTNEYTDSPANCSLEGTIAALREEIMKKTEIKITDKKTNAMGLVV